MVRSTVESEWDEGEQAWMLALAAYRAALCPHCGRPLSVCADPASEGRWEVPPATRCYATTAVSEAAPTYQESPHPGALLLHARRRE